MMWASVAYTQTAGTGAITGTVTDTSGAAIPNAIIEATNANTGQQRTVTTAADGTYRFALLPPGTYRVRFTAVGFTTAEVQVTVNVTETPGDLNNFALNYGPSAVYRPHRYVVNYTWQLPFGHPAGIAGKLIDGWSLSDVTTIQSGTPMTVTDSRGGTIYGLSSSTAQLCPGMTYADMASKGDMAGDMGSRLGGAAGGQGYFNKAAFCNIPTVSNGTGFGNTGIGTILGPGQFNFDTALTKSTQVGGLHEDARLEFRAEFFNLFNHTQFSNPATANGVSTFGQITTTSVNSRLIQLALKYVF